MESEICIQGNGLETDSKGRIKTVGGKNILYTDEMLFQIIVRLIESYPEKEEDMEKISPKVKKHNNHSRKGTLSRREKNLHVARKRAELDEEEKQVGRYYKNRSWYERWRRFERLENNSPCHWWSSGMKRWKDTACDQYYALDLNDYIRDMNSRDEEPKYTVYYVEACNAFNGNITVFWAGKSYKTADRVASRYRTAAKSGPIYGTDGKAAKEIRVIGYVEKRCWEPYYRKTYWKAE